MATEDPEFARNKPPDLIGDCRLMLRHALKEGLDIPADLQHDLTALDQELARCNITTLANVSTCLLSPGSATVPLPAAGAAAPVAPPGGLVEAPTAAGDSETKQGTAAQSSGDAMQLLYKVHGALLRVVAPATVGSLLATEPMHGAERMVFRGMPIIVKLAAIAAIVCAIGFILTSLPVTENKSDGKLQSQAETGGAETNRAGAKNATLPPSSVDKGANTRNQP